MNVQKLILVADDDPVVRHLLTSVLAASGYPVESVESGAKCLEFLSEKKDSGGLPDLLFLDLQLSDMAGTEVLEKGREILQGSALPVVMLSANTEEEILETYPELVVDSFLEKPFPPDKLLQVVRSLLGED